MNQASFNHLFTPEGQEVLAAATALAPREIDFLAHYQNLSRLYPPELARAGLEIATLRLEAAAKFPQAARLYLTREALQQASAYRVSSYRAQRYRGFGGLIDLGCSVGADTLALAEQAPVVGIDLDPLRLAMARANLKALNLQAEFIQADLRAPLPLVPPGSSPLGLFFDPARRVNGRRITRVEGYIPPLSTLRTWLTDFPALGVKISPGVNLAELAAYQAEIEFISLHGQLKEAVLWFGPLKSTLRRATLLPGPHTLLADDDLDLPASIQDPLAYLYEPDAAVLRSRLVRDLAVRLNAHQLDPDIAYLTSDQKIETPFARVWEIEAWFPFQLKRLRTYLRERRVGRLVVKKRGSPLQPEALIRALRLKGDGERVVFLSHLRGRPIVVVAYPEG